MSNATAILLITCKDHQGLVARVAGFIHEFGGNILDSDHHTDRGPISFIFPFGTSQSGLKQRNSRNERFWQPFVNNRWI